MYFQKVGEKFYFIYYDVSLRKNVRLKTKDTPNFKTEEEALAFCRSWDSKLDAMRSRIAKKTEWHSKYHAFHDLMKLYEKVRREDAPNSYDADIYYLDYYILPFFLEKKGLPNANLWVNAYEEFKDELLVVKPLKLKKTQNSLSYATKNNIIKTLNTFMAFMHRRRQIERLDKCQYFPKSKLNSKDETSVISHEERDAMMSALEEINDLAAQFFWVSLHTGLRLNELLGLSLANFFGGESKNEDLNLALNRFELGSHGYIAIDSQPKSAIHIRTPIGTVPRKPLKGKKKISHENSRVIPILNSQTFNRLVKLWNKQQELFRSKRYGVDPKNYLLFDGLNKNIYSNALRLAQIKMNRPRPYTPHDTRHTYSTWLVSKTAGDYNLCKLILGHTSLDVTLKYVHLNAQIHKSMTIKEQLETPMKEVHHSKTLLYTPYKDVTDTLQTESKILIHSKGLERP